jgi:hypothetical protein
MCLPTLSLLGAKHLQQLSLLMWLPFPVLAVRMWTMELVLLVVLEGFQRAGQLINVMNVLQAIIHLVVGNVCVHLVAQVWEVRRVLLPVPHVQSVLTPQDPVLARRVHLLWLQVPQQLTEGRQNVFSANVGMKLLQTLAYLVETILSQLDRVNCVIFVLRAILLGKDNVSVLIVDLEEKLQTQMATI